MKRRNIEVEELQLQVHLLREQIERMRADPGDSPLVACCDHGCVVAMRTGVGTNGGCLCDDRKLRRAVRWWRRVAEHRQITIQEMREREGAVRALGQQSEDVKDALRGEP